MSEVARQANVLAVERQGTEPFRRPWLIGLGILVLLAVAGAAAFMEINKEIGHGPNQFVLSSGSTRPGHINYSYNTFNGLARDKSQVNIGQTIQVTFSTNVTKGSLSMEVKDPTGGSLWRVNVPEHQTRHGTAQISAHRSGQYQFVVTGLDTGGSFDLSWRVK